MTFEPLPSQNVQTSPLLQVLWSFCAVIFPGGLLCPNSLRWGLFEIEYISKLLFNQNRHTSAVFHPASRGDNVLGITQHNTFGQNFGYKPSAPKKTKLGAGAHSQPEANFFYQFQNNSLPRKYGRL